MVTKITFPKAVSNALNYNEQKVQRGVAEYLGGGNVLNESCKMNFYTKLAIFENRNTLNDRATIKTLHVSLNFSPGEKLNEKQLMTIAEGYMEKIGFEQQPYFVYKHLDAGHPHLHIVSTTIRADGSRINTHNIGRNQSEKARKEIEQEFGLFRAEQQKNVHEIEPINIDVVVYGKAETKRGIANVVDSIFNRYNYTSLAEFNAVLKQYNVVADRGEGNGRIYKYGGLIYRVLDEEGNKVGVPIKASAISSTPTLTCLEHQFEMNKLKREVLKFPLKNAIDKVFKQTPSSMQEFIHLLNNKNIYTVLRQNEEGRLYGITFVDNQNKAVFNSSDIGKEYSIAALQTRLYSPASMEKKTPEEVTFKTAKVPTGTPQKQSVQLHLEQGRDFQKDCLLQQLITPELAYENVPAQLLKKNKKKKNRNL